MTQPVLCLRNCAQGRVFSLANTGSPSQSICRILSARVHLIIRAARFQLFLGVPTRGILSIECELTVEGGLGFGLVELSLG